MAEPAITVQAVHTSAGDNLPITRIVVHATCPDVGYPDASKPGAASGTAKYFAQASSGGSAHYVEGVDSEQHCVHDAVIAWHAPPNAHSIGVEITADGGGAGAFNNPAHAYTREQWLSQQVWPAVQRAAARVRELCQRFGVPMVRLSTAQVKAEARGICGHVDVSLAFGQSDHTDPGPNFPWVEFMALVTGSAPAPVPQEDDEMISTDTQNWIEGRMDAHDAYILANLHSTLGGPLASLMAKVAAQDAVLAELAKGNVDPTALQGVADAAAKAAVADLVASLAAAAKPAPTPAA